MKIIAEKLECKLLETVRLKDNRGWFQISFNQEELKDLGVDFKGVCQLNHSYTEHRGVIRGLNYQQEPYQQSKLVRCVKGKLYSVAVDIDPNSKNYGRWCGFELSADNGHVMYVPRTYAHGFITESQECELEYFTDQVYSYESAKSIYYSDPLIGIDWSNAGNIVINKEIISEKNRNAPFLNEISDTNKEIR